MKSSTGYRTTIQGIISRRETIKVEIEFCIEYVDADWLRELPGSLKTA